MFGGAQVALGKQQAIAHQERHVGNAAHKLSCYAVGQMCKKGVVILWAVSPTTQIHARTCLKGVEFFAPGTFWATPAELIIVIRSGRP